MVCAPVKCMYVEKQLSKHKTQQYSMYVHNSSDAQYIDKMIVTKYFRC